jgi:hypothetical protein
MRPANVARLSWQALIIAHRYLGGAVGLLMVMWFVSGIVMMYVGFPTPRKSGCGRYWRSPGRRAANSGSDCVPTTSRFSEPRWKILPASPPCGHDPTRRSTALAECRRAVK